MHKHILMCLFNGEVQKSTIQQFSDSAIQRFSD